MYAPAPMRSLVFAFAALAACGKAPPVTSPGPTPPTASPVVTEGNSGFEGVSWNDPIARLRALYPTLGEDARVAQPFEGLSAMVAFDLTGDVVHSIHVRIDGAYPGMSACLETWKGLRTRLDQRLGASLAENGAAFWETATSNVTLSCNLTDAGAAELAIDYAPIAHGE